MSYSAGRKNAVLANLLPPRNRSVPNVAKEEAIKLAKLKGAATAAKELGIYESQLCVWRSASQKKVNTSQRESELAAEVAKLKRQLAERNEEIAILKKVAVDSICRLQATQY